MSTKTELAVVTAQKLNEYLTAMGLAKDLKESEKSQFLEIAQAYGLNPFKREIYVTKYGENFSIIVGFETYLKRAERSGLLQGWNVTTSGKVQDNSLKATITIYRKDWAHPFTHEVYYAEYVQKTRAGEVTKFWKDKPVTMTKKVAISQGFRMCFSDELGGMPYTADEIADETQYQKYIDVSEPKNDVAEAIKEISECDSLECLKSIWGKHKKHQKDVTFIQAKNEKKDLLTTPLTEVEEVTNE
jgi:phage recombination protein Bet